MALTDKLTAIADAIRAKGDTTEQLTLAGMVDAINAIQTGSGGTGLAYDMGEFVFDAGFTATLANSIAHPIPHNLGDIPDFVMVWSDNWVGNTEVIDTDYSTMVGFMWFRELTGMAVRASSAAEVKNPIILFMSISKNDYRLSVASPTSVSYCINLDKLTATEFYLPPYGNANYWRGGVTYKYFVSKAWWNIGGVASAE